MKTQHLTLQHVETLPERDPYQSQADAATCSQFYLDPRMGNYGIIQEQNDGVTPMSEYHNLVLTATREAIKSFIANAL